MVAADSSVNWSRTGQSPLLESEICMQVDLRGLDTFVAEPECDHRCVDAAFEQSHRGGVAECVRSYVFVGQRGTSAGGDIGILRDQPLNPVVAQPAASLASEDQIFGPSVLLMEPVSQHSDGMARQGRAPFFATLALAPKMRLSAQPRVGPAQPGQLGNSQPRLDGYKKKSVVASANPAGAIRAGKQGSDLGR